jgi:hypothetical protein
MNSEEQTSRQYHRMAIVITAVFAFHQLAITLLGYTDSGAICDDAFYYLQIAKNAARGNGFSFDGVYQTNGFHPLLAWIQVPILYFTNEPFTPVRVSESLLALAGAATGYVLFRTCSALGNQRAGLLASVFYFLSPFSWLIPLRGCEGALSMLTVVLGAWRMATLSGTAITLTSSAQMGALVGLSGLARTENVLWGVAVAAWLVQRCRPLRAAQLACFVATALAVISPWVVWNVLEFGTVVQVSGAAKVALKLFRPLPDVHSPIDVVRVLGYIFVWSSRFVAGEEFVPLRATLVLMPVMAGLVGCAAWQGRGRPFPPELWPIFGLVVLHLVYYGFIQKSYFNWYFMPVSTAAALYMGERFSHARRDVVRLAAGAAALACGVSLARFVSVYGVDPQGMLREIEPGMEALKSVPRGSTAGGWNIGRVGYFGEFARPDVRIFNLDCVVNNALFEARSQGAYMGWVERHVDYLVEHPQGEFELSDAVRIDQELYRVRRPANSDDSRAGQGM